MCFCAFSQKQVLNWKQKYTWRSIVLLCYFFMSVFLTGTRASWFFGLISYYPDRNQYWPCSLWYFCWETWILSNPSISVGRVRTVLENPWKPWNLKKKIQALENLGIWTLALEKSWQIGDLKFLSFLRICLHFFGSCNKK